MKIAEFKIEYRIGKLGLNGLCDEVLLVRTGLVLGEHLHVGKNTTYALGKCRIVQSPYIT